MPKNALMFPHSNYQPRKMNPAFPVVLAVMNGSESFLYHWHDAIEILMGLHGETTVEIQKDSYTLTPGKILIINSGESHSILPSARTAKRLVLNFSSSVLLDDRLKNKELSGIYGKIERFSDQWEPADYQEMKEHIYKIWNECAEKQPGWHEMCLSMLLELTLYAYRNLPRSSRSAHTETGILRATFSYLSMHYLENISLESCASALGFNRTYLSHQFKKQTGVSFHKYVIDMRLKRAEKLLQSTDLPVTAISRESGFKSIKSFYRIFKERYHKSPDTFRKETRSGKS